jgi:hypothetical protein
VTGDQKQTTAYPPPRAEAAVTSGLLTCGHGWQVLSLLADALVVKRVAA